MGTLDSCETLMGRLSYCQVTVTMPSGGKQVTYSGTNSQGSSYSSYSDGGYRYSNASGSSYYNTGNGHSFYNSGPSGSQGSGGVPYTPHTNHNAGYSTTSYKK